MKKIVYLSLAVVLGGGLLVLLIAAINKKNHKNCTGITITINGQDSAIFLTRREVLAMVSPGNANTIKGTPLASFDLKKMEQNLEQNVWVKDAQLFFDNNGILRVSVLQRVPVARIFTVNDNSFYIDSSGKQLPLSSRATVKLPVYSNFPADKEKRSAADSLLMQQIIEMNAFILSDPFWMAQVAQIDITPNRTFEIIPVIGKHIIAFGDGTDYRDKFHRLLLFYRQIGAQLGLDKYSVINVAYNNQVVATRKGTAGKIDSLQALKNIQKMIEAARQVQYDTVSTVVDNNNAASAAPMPPLTVLKDNPENIHAKEPGTVKPVSKHPPALKRRPAQLPKTKTTVHPARQPKAVMRSSSG